MCSQAQIRILAGPIGSGKTTACIFELLRRAAEQTPAADGYRYSRFAIVRQTLQQLKMTVLKDILSWFRDFATFKVSENTIYLNVGDIKSEWILIPLEDPEDQKRLLSSQLTGVWMSECIEMDVGLVGASFGRTGRYPAGNQGSFVWRGLIADTNMPSEGSDWHRLMELERPPSWDVFVQPGGLEADAENLDWLLQTDTTLKLALGDPVRLARGRQYYIDLLNGGHSADWLKRYVHAKYGDDPSGTAVFRESFISKHAETGHPWHVVDNVEPIGSSPIIVSQDFGRDPWSLITQIDHKGRLLILEEVAAEDIGLEQHVERALRPALMQERYLGRPVAIVGDPSGTAKSTIYEETSFDALKRLGFVAFPAPTNQLDKRLRAVESFLVGSRAAGAAMVIDRARCPVLVRAMSGGYRYEKTRSGQRKPLPAKNKYSHVADALQYACLVAHNGYINVIGQRLRRVTRPDRVKVTAAAWT